MEHPLSITWVVGKDAQGHELRSLVSTVTAETGLGPSPQLTFPDTIPGKLVDVPLALLNQLKFEPGVEVTFSGRRYKFSQLENDGTFELRKDWQE